jgi:hypothetical protein
MRLSTRSTLSVLVVITAGAVACSSNSKSSSNGSAGDAGMSTASTDSSSGSGSSSGGENDSGTPPGPGAFLKCTSSGKNAWETYGAQAFVAVNESIFANVTAQITDAGTSNLGDSFTKIGSANPPSTADDLPTFKGNLAAFLVHAYGGPASIMYTDGKTYSGLQDMKAAHTGLAITADQYNYFIANIVVPALTDNGVPTDDVTSCFAPVVTDAAFVASIVGH